MAGGWRIAKMDENQCIAIWDRVLVQIWRGETTSIAVADLINLGKELIAGGRARISSLAIIEASAPPPAEVSRMQLSRFYREYAPQMGIAIVCAEGGSFRSAFVRGVGITLSMFAPRTLPFTFSSNVKDAAALLAPHLSMAAGGPAALLTALGEIRAEMRPRA